MMLVELLLWFCHDVLFLIIVSRAWADQSERVEAWQSWATPPCLSRNRGLSAALHQLSAMVVIYVHLDKKVLSSCLSLFYTPSQVWRRLTALDWLTAWCFVIGNINTSLSTPFKFSLDVLSYMPTLCSHTAPTSPAMPSPSASPPPSLLMLRC